MLTDVSIWIDFKCFMKLLLCVLRDECFLFFFSSSLNELNNFSANHKSNAGGPSYQLAWLICLFISLCHYHSWRQHKDGKNTYTAILTSLTDKNNNKLSETAAAVALIKNDFIDFFASFHLLAYMCSSEKIEIVESKYQMEFSDWGKFNF